MIRDETWKYIYMANGGREQLFNLETDPREMVLRNQDRPEVVAHMRSLAKEACKSPGAADALDDSELKSFEFEPYDRVRCYQFDASRGIHGFPDDPGELYPHA